jgi:hypothetical protein
MPKFSEAVAKINIGMDRCRSTLIANFILPDDSEIGKYSRTK